MNLDTLFLLTSSILIQNSVYYTSSTSAMRAKYMSKDSVGMLVSPENTEYLGECQAFCCCCWVTSVVSDSVWPQRRQPTRLRRPWDSPGKNNGVGCHFLLQCMKVKSEREVAQSGPTLHDPMDCSPPDFSVHGIFQARVLEWGAVAFSGIMLLLLLLLSCFSRVRLCATPQTLCNPIPGNL